MKFTLASLITLALASTTVMALAEPAPAAAEPTYHTDSLDKRALEKRHIVDGRVKVDNLEAHVCPQNSCTTVHHYHKGDHIDMVCYTRFNTTVVNNDAGWAELTSGYWVALANGLYVYWRGLPECN